MSQVKRRRSSSTHLGHLPHDSINPLSHSPGTLKQFAVAGLTDYEHVPSRTIPGFPHRPLQNSSSFPATFDDDSQPESAVEGGLADDDGGNTTADSQARQRRKSRAAERKRNAQDTQLGLLTNVILRSLEEGNIPRAKRAFGLLRRSNVQGRPVDLRKNGLWALGAEILMREGEEPLAETPGESDGSVVEQDRPVKSGGAYQRWGRAANIGRVKAYFENLIRQHPYNRLFPKSISAIDFWPAMLGCEVYNVYIEQKLALERLELEPESWDNPSDDGESFMDEDMARGADGGSLLDSHERRLWEEKNRIRMDALASMRDIASRMNDLVDAAPFSTDHELLRLQGMVALYMSDLVVPPAPRSTDDDHEAQRNRTFEKERAKRIFLNIVDLGGQLDTWIEDFVDPDREMDEEPGSPVFFSSLPIR